MYVQNDCKSIQIAYNSDSASILLSSSNYGVTTLYNSKKKTKVRSYNGEILLVQVLQVLLSRVFCCIHYWCTASHPISVQMSHLIQYSSNS